MAERAGFEPAVQFPVHTLSRRAPSTTRTSLHCAFQKKLCCSCTSVQHDYFIRFDDVCQAVFLICCDIFSRGAMNSEAGHLKIALKNPHTAKSMHTRPITMPIRFCSFSAMRCCSLCCSSFLCFIFSTAFSRISSPFSMACFLRCFAS